MLDFLRGRALPGVEVVDATSYARVIGPPMRPGWLRVSQWPRAWPRGEHALKLELHGAPPARMLEIVNRLRRMFDLDADPRAIADALSVDRAAAAAAAAAPGAALAQRLGRLRDRGARDHRPADQRRRARTLAARVCRNASGSRCRRRSRPGSDHLFPTPEALADADLPTIGLTRARAETVRTVARALLDGRVDFRPERTLDDFTARWVALPGHRPVDRALHRAARARPSRRVPCRRPGAAARGAQRRLAHERARRLRAQAEAWRPWRGVRGDPAVARFDARAASRAKREAA